MLPATKNDAATPSPSPQSKSRSCPNCINPSDDGPPPCFCQAAHHAALPPQPAQNRVSAVCKHAKRHPHCSCALHATSACCRRHPLLSVHLLGPTVLARVGEAALVGEAAFLGAAAGEAALGAGSLAAAVGDAWRCAGVPERAGGAAWGCACTCGKPRLTTGVVKSGCAGCALATGMVCALRHAAH